MRRRSPWLALIALTPLLLGSADQTGDLVSCDGTISPAADAPIDIVRARGSAVESGLALRFTVEFADPPPVPDEDGRPFRVDVLLSVPSSAEMSVDYYRGLNRILRFDALSPKAGVSVILLPERSATPYLGGAEVDGETITMSVPSRMVMQDPDLEGFDYSDVRWTVVAQDEATCDLLGERARPTMRIVVPEDRAAPPPSPGPVATAPDAGDPPITGGFVVACVLSIALGAAAGFLVARRRRRAG